MDSLEPVLEPLSFYAFNKLEELMSAAITQAENEKLEEAARVASDESIHPLADQIAERIRSLIQKD